MCGIAGWSRAAGVNDSLVQLDAMTSAIAHRGPDDRGTFADAGEGIAIGHVRLSIIDLSNAGHQPMPSDDGSVTLAFNGELYNYKELRHELEESGRAFHSRSDTEVAANAFATGDRRPWSALWACSPLRPGSRIRGDSCSRATRRA